MPLHSAAGAHPDALDGEPELLQPDADPYCLHPHQRRRRRPPRPYCCRRRRRRRRRRLLQHLVDQELRLDVPRLLCVHLAQLAVVGGRCRRRCTRRPHLSFRSMAWWPPAPAGDELGGTKTKELFLHLPVLDSWTRVLCWTVIYNHFSFLYITIFRFLQLQASFMSLGRLRVSSSLGDGDKKKKRCMARSNHF